jgi:hypothetical protein
MTWTTRDDLVLSIRMGLTKGLRLVHGMRRKLSIEERDTISRAIADHLKLTNWKIEKGPPLEAHGGSGWHIKPADQGKAVGE